VTRQRTRGLHVDTKTSLAHRVIGIGMNAAPSAETDDPEPEVAQQIGRRLAQPLELERVYDPNRAAMLAGLRVALDLPRQLPERDQGDVR
jgi:hypothetical protein